MTESTEAAIAVLKRDVTEIRADFEKQERLQEERRKLDDERHAALMAKLQHMELAMVSGAAFNRGVTTAVKAGWAVLGGAVVWAVQWLANGGMRP